MSRIIKLTESDIVKLVKKVLNEQWVYQSNKKGGYTLINGPYQGIEAKKLFPSYSEQQYPKELDKNKNPHKSKVYIWSSYTFEATILADITMFTKLLAAFCNGLV